MFRKKSKHKDTLVSIDYQTGVFIGENNERECLTPINLNSLR